MKAYTHTHTHWTMTISIKKLGVYYAVMIGLYGNFYLVVSKTMFVIVILLSICVCVCVFSISFNTIFHYHSKIFDSQLSNRWQWITVLEVQYLVELVYQHNSNWLTKQQAQNKNHKKRKKRNRHRGNINASLLPPWCMNQKFQSSIVVVAFRYQHDALLIFFFLSSSPFVPGPN